MKVVIEIRVYYQTFNANTILSHVLASTEWLTLKMMGKVATYNMPRVQTLIHLLRSVPGRIMAGSFPPSSSVTGVRFFTADAAICDDG